MKSSPAPFDGSWANNAWKRRKSQQFWVFLLGFTLPLLLGPVPISAQQWNKEAKNSLAVESSIDTASDSEVGEDTAYGQWMAKTEAAEGKVPMQFIRKFSWERTAGGAGQRPGAKEVERRRRPPVAEIEYDEVLAARLVAEEDVDRLIPAEGGDRPNFAVQPKWSTDGQAAGPNEQNQLAMTPWLSSVAPNFSSTSTARPKQPSMGVLQQQQQQQQKSAFDRTMALSEMDLKSDWDLAKMMRRTTLKTRDFSGTGAGRTTPLMSTTTPLPFLAVPQPPPAFLGLLLPQSAPLAQQQQPWQQNRRGLRAEQFEQLGCGWDWLSQGCRDVFRFGWCQNCHDFGNPFLHDCRCTAVTGLYVQTATFLGSNAASARANAAVSAAAANQTGGTGGAIVPLLPGLSLLPTLEQLAAPLNSATGSPSPVASFSPSLMPPTVTPVSQMVQALANAFQLPQPTAAPSLSLLGVQPAADQAPARPISGSPLLGPPAFGAVQFAPAGNQIVPRYISVDSGKKKRR